jgi:hypothetical protein
VIKIQRGEKELTAYLLKVFLPESDIKTLSISDTFFIDGREYVIISFEKTRTGGYWLELHPCCGSKEKCSL